MKIDLSEDIDKFKHIEFDDWPDQESEARVAEAIKLCIDAVHEIAEAFCKLEKEEDLVEFSVAIKLTQRFHGKVVSQVSADRLAERQRVAKSDRICPICRRRSGYARLVCADGHDPVNTHVLCDI